MPRTVGTLQCFGSSPRNKNGIHKNLLKYLEKMRCHQIIPERHKSLQRAGAWPRLTEPCSAELSACGRGGRFLGLRAN